MRFCLIVTLLFLVSSNAFAENFFDNDPRKYEISLITVGPGPQLYSTSGHTLLRVQNNAEKLDVLFNWGIFNSNKDNFLYEFVQQRLNYKLAIQSTANYFSYHKNNKMRSITEDIIRLTDDEKSHIIKNLRWWSLKENREYLYHIYENNCATKVRDIIYDSLPQYKTKRLNDEKLSVTLRDLWRQEFGSWSFVMSFCDLLFNSDVDHKISVWDSLFVPEYLRKSMLSSNLVAQTITIQEGLFSRSYWPHSYLLFSAFIVLILAFVFHGYFYLGIPNLALKVLGWTAILWSSFSTVVGLLFFLILVFTDRTYWFGSSNMLLLWGVDFVFIISGLSWVRGRVVEKGSYLGGLTILASKLHIFLAVVYIFYLAFFRRGELLLLELCTLAPTIILFYLVVLRVGFDKVKSGGERET